MVSAEFTLFVATERQQHICSGGQIRVHYASQLALVIGKLTQLMSLRQFLREGEQFQACALIGSRLYFKAQLLFSQAALQL